MFRVSNHLFTFVPLTELYFLIAQLLDQGPCRNAAEVSTCNLNSSLLVVIHQIYVILGDFAGPEAGAGVSRGKCRFWSVLVGVSTCTARAFYLGPNNIVPDVADYFYFALMSFPLKPRQLICIFASFLPDFSCCPNALTGREFTITKLTSKW